MFLPDSKYAILSMQWYLPRGYNKCPPDGRYILWSCCVPWPCDNYDELYPERLKNYSHCLSFGSTKIKRRFTPEAKANIRKQRLEARVNRKMPLFAETAIQKKITENQDYFDPEKIALADVKHRLLVEKANHDLDMQYLER